MSADHTTFPFASFESRSSAPESQKAVGDRKPDLNGILLPQVEELLKGTPGITVFGNGIFKDSFIKAAPVMAEK